MVKAGIEAPAGWRKLPENCYLLHPRQACRSSTLQLRTPAPSERLDLDYALSLIRKKKYFIIDALRQTRKTSTLTALQDRHLIETAPQSCRHTCGQYRTNTCH